MNAELNCQLRRIKRCDKGRGRLVWLEGKGRGGEGEGEGEEKGKRFLCAFCVSYTHKSAFGQVIHFMQEILLQARGWLQKIPTNLKLLYATRP